MISFYFTQDLEVKHDITSTCGSALKPAALPVDTISGFRFTPDSALSHNITPNHTYIATAAPPYEHSLDWLINSITMGPWSHSTSITPYLMPMMVNLPRVNVHSYLTIFQTGQQFLVCGRRVMYLLQYSKERTKERSQEKHSVPPMIGVVPRA